jgi:hypothetical protein
MSEDRGTEPLPPGPTAMPGGGPSVAQPQTVAPPPIATTSASTAGTAPIQIVPTGASAFHAPSPTMTFQAPAPAPITPTQGPEIEYAPIAAPPRAASGHSHPSLRPYMPEPMRHTIASMEDAATLSGYGQPRFHGQHGLGTGQPLPPLPHDGRRPTTSEAHTVGGRRPGIDWIVPVEEKVCRLFVFSQRLSC